MDTAIEHPIKVIITEDMTLFRTGVKNALAAKPGMSIIGEAEHGLQLLQLLEHLHPDIILLNIQMPIMDGMTVLPILKQKYPGIKVIILSMHNDPGVVCKMIELGANGYLTKEAGSQEIYEAIQTCYKKWFLLNETVVKALILFKLQNKPSVPITYTENELRILKLLQSGQQVNSIATEVRLSPRTVLAIIDKLKTTACVTSMEALIESART